jgi:hypothetical protein
MKRRVDWASIRGDYINGDGTVTYAVLAAKYRVRADVIARRAAKEHWTRDRQARADAVVEATAKSVLDGAHGIGKTELSSLVRCQRSRRKLWQCLGGMITTPRTCVPC